MDQQAIYQEQLRLYVKLKGGYTFPLAGATYWLALAYLGTTDISQKGWIIWAFIASGAIFPLAVVYSRLLGVNFFTEKSPTDGVVFPALMGMLLFWPIAVVAFWEYPELTPLVLAIGMSMHWPVIGWSYGRTSLYFAHALVRALLVTVIWLYLPEQRLTLLPAAVAFVYLATAFAVLVDVAVVRRTMSRSG